MKTDNEVIALKISFLFLLFLLAIPLTSLISVADGSSNNTAKEEWKTAYIRVVTSPSGTHDATIRYKLSSGEIERGVILADPYFQQLSINIISNSSGTLILELPRSVIDSKMSDNVTDASLTAFFRQDTNIVPAAIHELNKTKDMRVVSIDFPVLRSDSTYNIGIQGSYVIPEFGTIAPIALGVCLVSVLFLTTRFRRFSSEKWQNT